MKHQDNALDLLRRDHKQVLDALKKLQKTQDEDEQQDLRSQVISDLQTHTELEEQVFYPFFLDATGREDAFEEANIEHDIVKYVLEQWADETPGSERMTAMTKVLAELVEHHVQEEEKELFPALEKTGADLEALATSMQEFRDNLDSEDAPSAGAA